MIDVVGQRNCKSYYSTSEAVCKNAYAILDLDELSIAHTSGSASELRQSYTLEKLHGR